MVPVPVLVKVKGLSSYKIEQVLETSHIQILISIMFKIVAQNIYNVQTNIKCWAYFLPETSDTCKWILLVMPQWIPVPKYQISKKLWRNTGTVPIPYRTDWRPDSSALIKFSTGTRDTVLVSVCFQLSALRITGTVPLNFGFQIWNLQITNVLRVGRSRRKDWLQRQLLLSHCYRVHSCTLVQWLSKRKRGLGYEFLNLKLFISHWDI
jgi:hypothetical protein